MDNSIVVSIHCITFNHAPYIRQCLEGFVMQKTNFRFEAVVHDDASTDGTQEVIKEYANKYPELIKPIYETDNQYKKVGFAGINEIMQPLLKGKYIAFCEGDDFWTDSLKLQKQYDALESNGDASFVYTAFNVVDQNSLSFEHKRFLNFMEHSHSGFIYFDLLVNMNFIMTLTSFFRKECLQGITNSYFDYGYFLRASRCGYAIYLPDVTGSYRINPTSIMNTNPKSLDSMMYPMIYNELKESLENENTTVVSVYKHPLFKTVIGYIFLRYIKKSTCKLQYLKLLTKNPDLYYYVIKGAFIRITNDSKFRKYLKSI